MAQSNRVTRVTRETRVILKKARYSGVILIKNNNLNTEGQVTPET
jgi:hypothetical protein